MNSKITKTKTYVAKFSRSTSWHFASRRKNALLFKGENNNANLLEIATTRYKMPIINLYVCHIV